MYLIFKDACTFYHDHDCYRDYASCSVAGNARIVRHHLLEFLSPISLHHATNFLAAIAVVWQDRRQSLSELSSQISVCYELFCLPYLYSFILYVYIMHKLFL